MIIFKRIATFLGLFVAMFGLSVSQASASHIIGSGKDAMFCITATFVMPKGMAIVGGNSPWWSNAAFNPARLKNISRCKDQGELKNNYVRVFTAYPVVGPYQLKVLAVACSSAGGAYVFKHTFQKPKSFTYRFKRSDYISPHTALFRKNCKK